MVLSQQKNADLFLDDIFIENKKGYKKNTLLKLNELRNIVKPGHTIVDITGQNLFLLLEIYEMLSGVCQLIIYMPGRNKALEYKKIMEKHNILVLSSTFKENYLKNNIADVIIANNILGDTKKNSLMLNEINRILHPQGSFFFIELVYHNKPHDGFKSYFKKEKTHVFNSIIYNFQEKLKSLKNCEYVIKLVGNGNYYFDSKYINSIQEFCDLLGYEIIDRENILSNILAVIIKGKRKKAATL
jgi:hypothetical protein